MFTAFYMICGHLVGDYIFQNDWMAKNKATHGPSAPRPGELVIYSSGYGGHQQPGTLEEAEEWDNQYYKGIEGFLACFTHCLLYTLAIYLFCFTWISPLGLGICFITHFLFDRYSLASKWMHLVGQASFAKNLAPWSTIMVDNTFHLLTLAAISLL